jgi:hypothetical protein
MLIPVQTYEDEAEDALRRRRNHSTLTGDLSPFFHPVMSRVPG